MKYNHLRRSILFLLAAMMLASCNKPANNLTDMTAIQTGDLILVALPMDYDFDLDHPVTDISSDTGEVVYAHVAIADVVGDSVYVIDATLRHGVDRHPIDTLFATFTLKDGSQPRYDIYRLRNNREAKAFVAKAMEFCGRGYDLDFDPQNQEQYCSELVRNSYITHHGDTLFAQVPMDFAATDGTMPAYWTLLFELIGSPIPQGMPGILPSDLARTPPHPSHSPQLAQRVATGFLS